MKRFTEARDAFGKVLKVDKKQSKVVGEYLKDVEREERLHADETKVQELMSTQVRMVRDRDGFAPKITTRALGCLLIFIFSRP